MHLLVGALLLALRLLLLSVLHCLLLLELKHLLVVAVRLVDADKAVLEDEGQQVLEVVPIVDAGLVDHSDEVSFGLLGWQE